MDRYFSWKNGTESHRLRTAELVAGPRWKESLAREKIQRGIVGGVETIEKDFP